MNLKNEVSDILLASCSETETYNIEKGCTNTTSSLSLSGVSQMHSFCELDSDYERFHIEECDSSLSKIKKSNIFNAQPENQGVFHYPLQSPKANLDITFSTKITNGLIFQIKAQHKILFKVNYPDEFFKNIHERKYFSVNGILKDSGDLVCFSNMEINRSKKIATILTMGVVQEYQNKKIGGKMLKKIIEELVLQGIIEIKLIVQVTNINAFKLYRSFGFTESRVIENYYDIFDNEIENKAYELTLIINEKRESNGLFNL